MTSNRAFSGALRRKILNEGDTHTIEEVGEESTVLNIHKTLKIFALSFAFS